MCAKCKIMSVIWNNDRELALLECYQAEPILWETFHKEHKNKNKVHDAWTRISNNLDIPIADLKKIKDSLMSSYRTYKKKVKDSITSGEGSDDIYKPIWVAYETMDAFLGDKAQCNETINTETTSLNEENLEIESISNLSNSSSHNAPARTIRRRKNPTELLIAEDTVKEALSTLKTTLNTRSTQEEDECDLHGKIIAKKLRKLSEDEREDVICEIYQMFHRGTRRNQPQTATYFSPASTHLSSPSPSPQPSPSYQRGYSSHTIHYPNIRQQRAQSSHSTYSEPLIPPQRPSSSRTPLSEISYNSAAPVIHIPEETSTPGSRVIITSNELINPVNEDSLDYNIIDKAFNYA